jgi:hypothetical protein
VTSDAGLRLPRELDATTEACSMFFALLMGLLVCCTAAAETPSPPQQDSTIYRSGERTTEIKENTPDRYDIYDVHGNRIGYGQRSPINGDIDFHEHAGSGSGTGVRRCDQ